jgi:hypothetical protein
MTANPHNPMRDFFPAFQSAEAIVRTVVLLVVVLVVLVVVVVREVKFTAPTARMVGDPSFVRSPHAPL